MPVFKIHKNNNYTVMSNVHLRDKNLSLKAKGLLSIMLSLPEDWDYSINGLVAICNQEKEHAVNSALKELKKQGYVLVDKKHVNGRYQYEYNVFECPNSKLQGQEIQAVENQGIEFQGIENHGIYKYTNKLNTNKLNTKKNNISLAGSYKNQNRIKQLFDLATNFCINYHMQTCKSSLEKYIQNSLELKKTLTVTSFQNQLEMLKNFNEQQIIDIINKTITRGWINVEYVINQQYRTSIDNMQPNNGATAQKLTNIEF